MYAVIKTGGKQYRVSEGDEIFIEKLDAEVDSKVEFNDVVAVSKDDKMVVGTPFVDGCKVVAKVIKNGRGKKIQVMTYRPKKDSKRKLGHRQAYSKVVIEAINA